MLFRSEVGLDRVRRKNSGASAGLDRMESKDLAFHRTVRERFLQQAADDPKHFAVADAAAEPQQVHERLMELLAGWRWARRRGQ